MAAPVRCDGEVYKVNSMYLLPAHWVGIRVGGKHYLDLGNATIALAVGGKGGRLKGTSEKLSDARCEDRHWRDLLSFTA